MSDKIGYFKLYRRFQENPIWTEKRVYSKFEAWLDILMEVRWKEETEQVLIKNQLIDCAKGQSLNCLETWGKRWGWRKKRVRSYFKLLQEMGMVRYEGRSEGFFTATSRLTVCNYAIYNSEGNTKETERKHEGNRKETERKHDGHTEEEGKEGEEGKERQDNTEKSVGVICKNTPYLKEIKAIRNRDITDKEDLNEFFNDIKSVCGAKPSYDDRDLWYADMILKGSKDLELVKVKTIKYCHEKFLNCSNHHEIISKQHYSSATQTRGLWTYMLRGETIIDARPDKYKNKEGKEENKKGIHTITSQNDDGLEELFTK